MKIPGLILKQMYTLGSLQNVDEGVRFSLKNRLADATLTRLRQIKINGRAVPIEGLTLHLADGPIAATAIGITTTGQWLNYVLFGFVWKTGVEYLLLPVTSAVIGWFKRNEPSYGRHG